MTFGIFIPGRLRSERLPNKLILPLGGSCLFDKACKLLDSLPNEINKYALIYDDDLIEIARNYPSIKIIKRDKDTTTTDGPLTYIFKDMKDVPDTHLMFLNPCLYNLSPGTIIRCIQEFVMKSHSNVPEMCKLIRNSLPNNLDIVVYGDCSGNFRSANSQYTSYQIIYDELSPYFKSLRFKVPKVNPPVRNRVDCVNNKLAKKSFKINKDCYKLIEDFNCVCYTEKGDIDKSNIEFTHISDAIGYYISYEFPLVKPQHDIKTKSY